MLTLRLYVYIGELSIDSNIVYITPIIIATIDILSNTCIVIYTSHKIVIARNEILCVCISMCQATVYDVVYIHLL